MFPSGTLRNASSRRSMISCFAVCEILLRLTCPTLRGASVAFLLNFYNAKIEAAQLSGALWINVTIITQPDSRPSVIRDITDISNVANNISVVCFFGTLGCKIG